MENETVTNRTDKFIYIFFSYVLLAFIFCEALSCFSAISRFSVFAFYAAILIGIALFVVKKMCCKQLQFPTLPPWIYVFLFFSICIVVMAILTIQYESDSLTYHLSRVYYWAKNGSVAHYETHDLRQLSSPVLPDFINLHIFLLTGTNRTMNLLQAFSYLASGIMVYKVAERLKLSISWGWICALLYFAIPIAFVETFTAQVDVFSGLIMLGFVYILFPYLEADHELILSNESLLRSAMIGVAVGLAYMAKTSLFFGIFAFTIWLLIICFIRRDHLLVCIVHFLVISIIALVLNLPEWFRNLHTFGTIVPQNVGANLLIGSLHERHLILNFYKNITMNLPTGMLYNSGYNVWKYGIRLARILRIDINDPAITLEGSYYDIPGSGPLYHPNLALNPLIMWLIIVSFVLFVILCARKLISKTQAEYFMAAFFGFILLCLFTRWQPFLTRFMIPYFAVLIPGIMASIASVPKLFKNLEAIDLVPKSIVVFLCVLELIGLFVYQKDIIIEQHRSYKEPEEAYFLACEVAYPDYRDISEYIEDYAPDSIGIIFGPVELDCVFAMIAGEKTVVKPILSGNESSIYADPLFEPSMIVTRICLDDVIVYNGHRYYKEQSFGLFGVYLPE